MLYCRSRYPSMLTGRQKRFLRAMGTAIDPILQIGKGGVNSNLIKQIDDALEAREIIKVKLLSNCDADIKEVADLIAEKTEANVAQIIGSKILLFRQSTKKPQIILP